MESSECMTLGYFKVICSVSCCREQANYQLPVSEWTPLPLISSFLSSKGKAPYPISSCMSHLFPFPKRYVPVCARQRVHRECITVFDSANKSPHLWEPFFPPSFSYHICALKIHTKCLHSWGNFCQRGSSLFSFLYQEKLSGWITHTHRSCFQNASEMFLRHSSCIMKVF